MPQQRPARYWRPAPFSSIIAEVGDLENTVVRNTNTPAPAQRTLGIAESLLLAVVTCVGWPRLAQAVLSAGE